MFVAETAIWFGRGNGYMAAASAVAFAFVVIGDAAF